MTDELHLVDKALANLPRNPRGEVDYDAMVDYIAARVNLDEDRLRRERAKKMIANRRKPGATPADGQLSFEGIDPYDWEPDRLVQGDPQADGSTPIVENRNALPDLKAVEATRKMQKAAQAMAQAQRVQREAAEHSRWATPLVESGEKLRDLPFGRFVHDSGTLVH